MLVKGSKFSDERGTVSFVNSFDMTPIVWMYCIEPKTRIILAWQGHKKESKWFYCVKGSFLLKTVDMNSLERVEYRLSSKMSEVLEIKPGLYNGFEALEERSALMVYSDFDLDSSKQDDFRETLENIKWESSKD